MLRIVVPSLILCVCLVPLSRVAAAPVKKPQKEAHKVAPPIAVQAPAMSPQGITYALKDLIKAKSAEFCASYGSEAGCIEEVEICLSMSDRDDDPIRICVNTAPDEPKPVQAARAR